MPVINFHQHFVAKHFVAVGFSIMLIHVDDWLQNKDFPWVNEEKETCHHTNKIKQLIKKFVVWIESIAGKREVSSCIGVDAFAWPPIIRTLVNDASQSIYLGYVLVFVYHCIY